MKGFDDNIRVVLKSIQTENRIEIQGCLVQQISDLNYEQAKELVEKLIKEYTITFLKEVYKKIYNQGRRVTQYLKRANSRKRYEIKEKWHYVNLPDRPELKINKAKVSYEFVFCFFDPAIIF